MPLAKQYNLQTPSIAETLAVVNSGQWQTTGQTDDQMPRFQLQADEHLRVYGIVFPVNVTFPTAFLPTEMDAALIIHRNELPIWSMTMKTAMVNSQLGAVFGFFIFSEIFNPTLEFSQADTFRFEIYAAANQTGTGPLTISNFIPGAINYAHL